jgi:DNA-directed RNA polymerase sigma subunit (sigma70/sigma32)
VVAVTLDYRVQTELGRTGRWWVITVPAVPGAHSQVRRLAEVEDIARELISLMTEQPADSFSVQVEVLLPEDVRRDLEQSAKLREQAAQSQARAAQLTRHAARRLRERGLPLRDIGQALGVSFQRAKQLVDEAENLAC